ncbi:MAG: hypothetical protein RL154_1493 [Pseudomonadota bacterium]
MPIVSDIVRMLFLSPFLVIIALFIAGVINARFRGFFITLALITYFLSTAYAPRILLKPLEGKYLQEKPNLAGVNAVVVLGGGINESAPDSKLADSAYKRFIEGLALAKSHNLPLLYSGGGIARGNNKISEADAAIETAIKYGKAFGFNVPIAQKVFSGFCIIGEKRSDTTAENAFFSANIFHDSGIAKPKIALVTSAAHLTRASMMFAKYGFDVVPYPVDFKFDFNASIMPSFSTLAPNTENLRYSLNALYEYLGLIKFYTFSK